MAGGTFGGGDGSELSPYIVEDGADLNAIRSYLTSYFLQNQDIDMLGFGTMESIGTSSNPFQGYYDGGNFKIENFKTKVASGQIDGFGIFNRVRGCSFKNVKIENAEISPSHYTGILVARTDTTGTCVFDNCYVSGSITSGAYGGDYSGGLVGVLNGTAVFTDCKTDFVFNSVAPQYCNNVAGFVGIISGGYHSFTNCSAKVDISGAGNTNTAGFVGSTAGVSQVFEKCYSTGLMTLHYKSSTVGGFVGGGVRGEYNECFSQVDIDLSVSAASGYGRSIGGFVGSVTGASGYSSTFTDCYAKSAMTSISISDVQRVGGFVGNIDGISGVDQFINCWSASTINGFSLTPSNYYGGFAGRCNPLAGAFFVDCFYDSTLVPNEPNTYVGITGKTSSLMKQQATFSDWDFESTWGIDPAIEEGYPYLLYQPILLSYTVKLIFRDKWSGTIINNTNIPWLNSDPLTWGGGSLEDLGGVGFDGNVTEHTFEAGPASPGTYTFSGYGTEYLMENFEVDVILPQSEPQIVDINVFGIQDFMILIDGEEGFAGLTVDMQADDAFGNPLIIVGIGSGYFAFENVRAGTYTVKITHPDIAIHYETVTVFPMQDYSVRKVELSYRKIIPLTGTNSITPLLGLRPGEIAGGMPAQSDGKRIGRSYFASANPKVYFACPVPVHPSNDPMWNLNFRVKVFYDAAATSEYLSVDTISNRELFRLAIGSVTGWETFPEGGVPPDKYGQLVECQINIPPKTEAYIRVDVGADEA